MGPGQVCHLWFGFEASNFSIFSPFVKKNLFGLGQKVPGSKAGQPLIYRGSKVSSGQVRAHLYWTPSLPATFKISGYCFLLLELFRVSQLWFGSGFGKCPLKITNFSNFSPFSPKKYLRAESKKSLVKLFTAGQKYAQDRAHLYSSGH